LGPGDERALSTITYLPSGNPDCVA
jgi:hypothetical protein